MSKQFPALKNDLLLRAARGEKTERAPVWIMRQAGRHLPEFMKLRESHGFFEICQTPSLACEVTLQPVRHYTGLLDAAIIFSDILVVPQAMGMHVIMQPGPHFTEPLNTPEDVKKLKAKVDVQEAMELRTVFEAITLTRTELAGEVPLIGFCGGPWTLFAYMIEGGGTRAWNKAKSWLFKYPEESKALLDQITTVCIDFLVAQAHAGAQLLQVFDTNAGELTPYDFYTFVFPSLQRIGKEVKERLKADGYDVPMTLFAKSANYAIAHCAENTVYDVLGLDWRIEGSEARTLVNGKTALQGNLDPDILYGGRDGIEAAVKRTAESFGDSGGWIANLGHGITPGVKPEDVEWFFQCVHKYSKR
ncbi:uroporphyrinogen decarboxylase [Cylindrobasidium torrendii FP15055 ss-10]|uniref:Uroporphyrinogen decarboxylase n=1 Tax=Cylindrobasidium torrendii FP15055 ss-10 TaxID=1314674 RepID=A0A0D7BQE2_9AGAR|nr:uroporphyrinogen decarboxylase [Cylindrobasidium torrendii FP15055 ss-10]